MDVKTTNDLLKGFQEGLCPIDNRPIEQWAKDNVKLSSVYSVPGFFNADKSRYMIKPLESLKDMRVREVCIMASPRCGKSLIAELFLLHTITNNAGTSLWLSSSDEQVDKFAELRLIPLLSGCKQVKQMIGDDRFAITKKRFAFPHMTVNISSAKIKALQSIGYKTIIFDEVWMADSGYIGEAKARLGDFLHTSKFLLLSQGGEEADDWETEFEKGTVFEYGWHCPSCNHLNTYEWQQKRDDGTYAGIVWDRNEKTKPNGVWNIEEAAKTAKFECFHCKHQIVDNPQNRRWMNDNGEYKLIKAGNPKQHSFRYNALANIEIPIELLVIEYLQAKNTFKREGNLLPLKEFYQKRLARPFKRNYGQVDIVNILAEVYDNNGEWADYRFMTVDCQKDFQEFYYIIRDWKKTGESRLVKHGRVATWEDVRAVQIEYKVKDQSVGVDSGYQASKVYAQCCKYGHHGTPKGTNKRLWLSWISLKGTPYIDFSHGNGVKRLYGTMFKGDPMAGLGKQTTYCPSYNWSGPSIKSIFTHLRDGKGNPWAINTDDPEYLRQLNSEVLTSVFDKKTNREKFEWTLKPGAANHWFDSECMNCVMACMAGCIGNN